MKQYDKMKTTILMLKKFFLNITKTIVFLHIVD